jgi:hypothetical protein
MSLPLSPVGGLANPTGVATDPAGKIYVARSSSSCDAIMVYAPGADGDSEPIAVISGDDTGLLRPAAIAVDSQGKIYVINNLQASLSIPRGKSIPTLRHILAGTAHAPHSRAMDDQ